MKLYKISLFIIILLYICLSTAYAGWGEPVPIDELNTPSGETYAYLSTNGRLLFWNAEGTICMSRRSGNSWTPRELLPAPVNTPDPERFIAITPDNIHLYWVSWRAGGFGRWDIWRCSWDESTNTFGAAECLGPNVNSPYDEFGMCFTPDGSRMYFVTNIPQKNGQYGLGDLDIWYCDWDSTIGDWGLPYNAGESVNTIGREYTPYISRAGTMTGMTLFFSTGHYHYLPGWQGITDILYAGWDGQNWINLANVGTPINSPVNDWSPCVSPGGNMMIFVTRRNREEWTVMELMVSYWEDSTLIEDNSDTNLPHNIDIDVYPNPFNSSTVINYSNIEGGEIKIYDITGRLIRTLHCGGGKEGKIAWDATDNYGRDIPSGVYFVKVVTPQGLMTLKLTYLK